MMVLCSFVFVLSPLCQPPSLKFTASRPHPLVGNLACVVGSLPALTFPREQQILFRKRFMDFQTDDEIMRLVDDSVRSWTTGQYDDFQQKTNGYLK